MYYQSLYNIWFLLFPVLETAGNGMKQQECRHPFCSCFTKISTTMAFRVPLLFLNQNWSSRTSLILISIHYSIPILTIFDACDNLCTKQFKIFSIVLLWYWYDKAFLKVIRLVYSVSKLENMWSLLKISVANSWNICFTQRFCHHIIFYYNVWWLSWLN